MVNKEGIAKFFYYFLILFLIIFMVFVFKFITSESRACIKQPFNYGAQKMGNLECGCQKPLNSMCTEFIYFNSTTFKIKVNEECKEKPNNYFNVTLK